MIKYPSKIPYDYAFRSKYLDTPFNEKEYKRRFTKVKNLITEKNLDALIVYSYPVSKELSGHLTYLTSFWGLGGDAVLLIPLDGEPTLLFDRITHGEPIHSCIWTTYLKNVHPSTRENLPLNIESWFQEHNLIKSRIGLVGEKMIPWDLWDKLKPKLPDVRWIPITPSFMNIQRMKSEPEMRLIRKICRITNEGMRAGVNVIKPGVTEGEVISKIHEEFARLGAHDFSFTSKITSGPRGGLKHSYPIDRKIKRGDLIYVDIGARRYGYFTDMSRVVLVGRPTSKQEKVLDNVKSAYYTILDNMKPGISVNDLDNLARELEQETSIYEKYGAKGAFMDFSISHGMSTGYHEWSLKDGKTILTSGLSPLAFEPMISIMDFGIVVIESMIEVTETGYENLTPLELDWM